MSDVLPGEIKHSLKALRIIIEIWIFLSIRQSAAISPPDYWAGIVATETAPTIQPLSYNRSY